MKRDERNVKICFLLSNGIEFDLNYPYYNEDEDYESLFKMEEAQNNLLELSFLRNKPSMVAILKKMRIYSYQGNFLKLDFKSQFERDVFLVNLLKEAGFDFEMEARIKAK